MISFDSRETMRPIGVESCQATEAWRGKGESISLVQQLSDEFRATHVHAAAEGLVEERVAAVDTTDEEEEGTCGGRHAAQCVASQQSGDRRGAPKNMRMT
jgi:hypothetical protein